MAQELDPALLEALKRAQTPSFAAQGQNVLPQPQGMASLQKGLYGPYVPPPSLGSAQAPATGAKPTAQPAAADNTSGLGAMTDSLTDYLKKNPGALASLLGSDAPNTTTSGS